MSIEDTRKVDTIGVEKKTGEVILTIADHLEWDDEQRHLLLLQDKINTYISFVESGELIQVYPDAQGRRVAISVVGKHKASPSAIRFFLKVKDTIEPKGISFRFEEFQQLKKRVE